VEKPAVLLLNVGNTNTEIAVAEAAGLTRVDGVSTAELLAVGGSVGLLAERPGDACLVACVVPSVRACLLGARPAGTVTFLDASMIAGIDFARVDTSTLGADRIANAAGAVASSGTPVIVLDCGTAITTEAVDADGRFRGGAIAPGRCLQRVALHTGTGQLPKVPLAQDLPVALGTNTASAIRAGIDLGAIGAAERLIAGARVEIGSEDCPVLVTGGDAPFFIVHLADVRAAPPNLTLLGLVAVAKGYS